MQDQGTPQTYELDLDDGDGRRYKGRVTGALIAESERNDTQVYLTDDERVIVYDLGERSYWVVEVEVERTLGELLEPGPYSDAMRALGIEPVIDI